MTDEARVLKAGLGEIAKSLQKIEDAMNRQEKRQDGMRDAMDKIVFELDDIATQMAHTMQKWREAMEDIF